MTVAPSKFRWTKAKADWKRPASAAASGFQKANATATQNTSDTSIGQTMSQSMRGCSRLAKP